MNQSAEERGAAIPHATFCGSREWVTAFGDPVGARQLASLPETNCATDSTTCPQILICRIDDTVAVGLPNDIALDDGNIG